MNITTHVAACALLLLAGWLAVPAALAQGPTRQAPALEARVINESFEPAVNVSGRTLKGVMAEPSGQPNDKGSAQRLYVWLPAGLMLESQVLCLSLSSRDGQYISLLEAAHEASSASPHSGPSWLPVDFTTREPDYYAQYEQTPPPHRLAVLVELKRDCSPATRPDAVLAAAWQDFSSPPETLTVLANSARLETLLAVRVDDAGGGKRQLGIPCRPIDAVQRIAYDTACQLDVARLKQEGTPQLGNAQLIRRRGSSVASQVPVELKL